MKIGGTNVIDFARVSRIPKFVVNVKEGDSKRKISLTLLENNVPVNLNNYTVVVACKKSDGNDVFNAVTKTNAVNPLKSQSPLKQPSLQSEYILLPFYLSVFFLSIQ